MIAIALVDEDFGIAKDGKQVCMIRDDLERFKTLTLHETIVYGRKTLEAFPGGKPLPERTNICLSRTLQPREDLQVVSTEDRINALRHQKHVFVVGGESIYRLFYDDIDTVRLTVVHHSFGADQFFPRVDRDSNFHLRYIHTPRLSKEPKLHYHYEYYYRE